MLRLCPRLGENAERKNRKAKWNTIVEGQISNSSVFQKEWREKINGRRL